MNVDIHSGLSDAHLDLAAAAEQSVYAIPPMWPLAATVAVNPFLGQTEEPLAATAARLERTAGASVSQPRAVIASRVADGTITDADLEAALAANASAGITFDTLKAALDTPEAEKSALPSVADLAAQASGFDWPAFVAERIGVWAGSYFDAGQALWSGAPGLDAFESWQTYAARDLSPEIAGLTGFAQRIAKLPRPARRTLLQTCDGLGISHAAGETYFHQLLLQLGGWAQLARKAHFEAEMAGETTPMVTDLLTVHLAWEHALLDHYRDEIGADWSGIVAEHAQPVAPSPEHIVDAILQEADERAHQRQLATTLGAPSKAASETRPALQAAFCIDVRSELFRRALEAQDDGIETIGFAGFFGLGAAHRDVASDVIENRLPVLLAPQLETNTPSPDDGDQRLAARASRAWGRFRQAAVSSFAFVEAGGPIYAGKLLRDALPRAESKDMPTPAPQLSDDLSLSQRADIAQTVLGAMGMTDRFAPLVLLLGHGAHVTNNAHASALQCGACGGHAGDVSARLLAQLLNDPDVRQTLGDGGLTIPSDTVFLAGLHNTTTDQISLYAEDLARPLHEEQTKQLTKWLKAAERATVAERMVKLPRATTQSDVIQRALDWAETRPEWGLAGCSAFIAAPRQRTRGAALSGSAFLHDYDWRKDEGFGVLELILTAPVVVASWISLAYYGAVVAPDVFGGGNKLLHNACGGVGTLEGNGGALRVGLPLQSVHDGTDFVHDARRLSVVVEAPAEAINGVLEAHPQVRALFENRWLHLFRMDDEGNLAQRYTGNLTWDGAVIPKDRKTPAAA